MFTYDSKEKIECKLNNSLIHLYVKKSFKLERTIWWFKTSVRYNDIKARKWMVINVPNAEISLYNKYQLDDNNGFS